MAIEHDSIPAGEIHEPKGVTTATSGSVYVANGGSGDWTPLNNLNLIAINVHHDEVDSATSKYVVAPVAGNIQKIYGVLDGGFTGGDTTLTAKIGGVSVTNGAMTFATSGSAAGDVQTATPSAANTVTAGQAIEFSSDGASSTAGTHVELTILLDVS